MHMHVRYLMLYMILILVRCSSANESLHVTRDGYAVPAGPQPCRGGAKALLWEIPFNTLAEHANEMKCNGLTVLPISIICEA